MKKNKPADFRRPGRLVEGQKYYRIQGEYLSEVRLLAYAASPAFVIICDPAGRRLRAAREELFSRDEPPHP